MKLIFEYSLFLTLLAKSLELKAKVRMKMSFDVRQVVPIARSKFNFMREKIEYLISKSLESFQCEKLLALRSEILMVNIQLKIFHPKF
jgi:hypothetical protein